MQQMLLQDLHSMLQLPPPANVPGHCGKQASWQTEVLQ